MLLGIFLHQSIAIFRLMIISFIKDTKAEGNANYLLSE